MRALIEEATVDAYGESEQAVGFYTMIGDNLELPFQTEVLGMEVTVEAVDITEDDQVVAVCRRGNKRQRIAILDLQFAHTTPSRRRVDCGLPELAARDVVVVATVNRPFRLTVGSSIPLLH